MSILLISRTRNMEPYRDALADLDSNLDIEIWPDIKSKDRVSFAVAWKQPKNQFSLYPNLAVVSSLGAGADHLLKDSSIPQEVALTRVVAPTLTDQMCDYVILSVLAIIRRQHDYNKQQVWADWKPRTHYEKQNLMVGVMGLGQIGKKVAVRLADNGFNVSGWSNSKKSIPNVVTYSKEQLDPFLNTVNVLVCLLPLTKETTDILNLSLFKKLNSPGFLVNAARGAHLVEEDLIYALDMGLLNHASLDVFQKEPLPESHPFWGRDRITITPHVASLTEPMEIAEQILENYKRMRSNLKLLNRVDRYKGY